MSAPLRPAGISPTASRRLLTEPAPLRWTLIGLVLAFLAVFLILPLVLVFSEALSKGWAAYRDAVSHPDALAALQLTLLAAAVAVPLNLIFGIAAGWTVAKFRFPGRSLLITLIDLPFAVSPVVSGLVFVLLFGRQGLLGPWMEAHNLHVIFAVPGIVLATLFVSFPFVAREIIPVMEAGGTSSAT